MPAGGGAHQACKQHAGQPAAPVVEEGEKVKKGQMIGRVDETEAGRARARQHRRQGADGDGGMRGDCGIDNGERIRSD